MYILTLFLSVEEFEAVKVRIMRISVNKAETKIPWPRATAVQKKNSGHKAVRLNGRDGRTGD